LYEEGAFNDDKKPLSNNSVKQMKASMLFYCRNVLQSKSVDELVPLKYKPGGVKVANIHPVLSKQELSDLSEKSEEHPYFHALINLLYFVGGRVQDMARLAKNAFEWVNDSKGRRVFKITLEAKKTSERAVILDPEVTAIMDAFINGPAKQEVYVFGNLNDTAL
jgi:site-specific recombinase XerD